MSMKIYGAYEWLGSLDSLIRRLVWVRARHKESALSRLLASLRPDSFYGRSTEYQMVLEKTLRSNRHEFLDDRFGEVPNVAASAVVYPFAGRLLVQFFGVSEQLARHSKMSDYHWQNSTDCPDGIIRKAWDERGRVWNRIFKLDGRPSRCGLVFEILDENDAWRMVRLVYARLHGHDEDLPYEKRAGCGPCRKTEDVLMSPTGAVS